MCGITGFYQFKNTPDARNHLKLMTDQLAHRGPDDEGIYCNEKIGLGHRRLSILDLSAAGHQPMFSGGQDLVIVFNGEIYNYRELKQQLLALGHTFNSQSDTEVIIEGFARWGPGVFGLLNGIFALALWDNRNSELYLVRDRLGVKPLYIYQTDDRLYFGSEIKSFRALCPELDRIDMAAFSSFLFYGNALGTRTLYQNVRSLMPGHFIRVNAKEITEQVYWKPEQITPIRAPEQDEEAIARHVSVLLEQAVSRQLISDVPVGIFLSGGIDSSAITAFASKHHKGKIKTFSAAFEFDKGVNELAKAKSVADHYGTDHQEFFIEARDLPEIVEKMVYHHDEPFSDAANIPLYLMARQVKPYATVVLQGDGGDELFGGYRRYELLQKLTAGKRKGTAALHVLLQLGGLRNNIYKRFLRMTGALGQKDDAMLMALMLTVDMLKENTRGLLDHRLRNKLLAHDPFEYYKITNERFKDIDLVQRMLYTDTQIILPNTFLEKVDKSTMAASIEVRVPLLDNELVDYVMALPSAIKVKGGEKKWLIKKALRGVVPDHILDGPKTGFGVPYENWLRKPLYDMMNDLFRMKYIQESGLFDYQKLDKAIKEHKAGTINHGFALWKLMNLCIWVEKNKIVLQ
ncbi:MAG: asparagine synthase (glutamine-hydrolyzing) [Bacteroidetes bacterium]|nr:asparagine synthase (glutamine-hydrolyzing) [Bacteroidota bacterium]